MASEARDVAPTLYELSEFAVMVQSLAALAFVLRFGAPVESILCRFPFPRYYAWGVNQV